MRTEAVRDVKGTVVARLAHGLVRLQLEGVITIQGRRIIPARSSARVTRPVDGVGDLWVHRRQSEIALRRYHRL